MKYTQSELDAILADDAVNKTLRAELNRCCVTLQLPARAWSTCQPQFYRTMGNQLFAGTGPK